MGRELLTAGETAEKLGISRRTLLRWARDNRIQSVKISRKKILFRREAVEDFLKTCTNGVESHLKYKGSGIRRTTAAAPERGGDGRRSRKSWRDLRKEVATWQ
jgi:excisionase family DNA binding protein